MPPDMSPVIRNLCWFIVCRQEIVGWEIGCDTPEYRSTLILTIGDRAYREGKRHNASDSVLRNTVITQENTTPYTEKITWNDRYTLRIKTRFQNVTVGEHTFIMFILLSSGDLY